MNLTVAEKLELLLWELSNDGSFKNKSGTRTMAQSRLLIGQIKFHNNVGYMGKTLRVAVVHLHRNVAKKEHGFARQREEYWEHLAQVLREHEVHVLMGDFNMALFKVVPELRSRGVPATLVAWYPWRSELGKVMMADSCGIFMCVPAICKPLFKENALDEKDLPSWGMNGGPGCSLDSFLPRTENLTAKLQPTFTAVAVENKGKGRGPPGLTVEDEAQNKGEGRAKGKKEGKRTDLTVYEKRLDMEVWKFRGQNHGGSHFPLAAFTGNVGRRSEERYIARSNRRYAQQQITAVAVADSRSCGSWNNRSCGSLRLVDNRSGGK